MTSSTLRLVCPQWQGAGTASIRGLASEFSFEVARRGCAVGATVLSAVLPSGPGATAVVPVTMGDEGLDAVDGVEAKVVLHEQLGAALDVIAKHDPARIVTLGGECAVSVAPFSALADRYGDDLAILWVDSHPDIGTPATAYPGFHAMAVSALVGHGHRDPLSLLPATVTPSRVALVGCTSGRTTTFPTSPKRVSGHSAQTSCGSRRRRCSIG